jgi:hypothetical protein
LPFDDIADCLSLLILDELREIEAEVMALA